MTPIAQRLADAGIEVKPLEWRQVGAMRLAYPYCFDDRGANWSHDRYPAWSMDSSRVFNDEFSSPGEAKAPCEADHAARILSALQEVKP